LHADDGFHAHRAEFMDLCMAARRAVNLLTQEFRTSGPRQWQDEAIPAATPPSQPRVSARSRESILHMPLAALAGV